MPKISVELSDDEYKLVRAMKYSVGNGSTHAHVMREALRLLSAAHDAAKNGDVVGIAKGKGQRARRVLAQPHWRGVEVTTNATNRATPPSNSRRGGKVRSATTSSTMTASHGRS